MRFKNIYLHFFFILIFSFLCKVANAVTLNFDDLDAVINDEGYLTTEYESQGILFEPYAFIRSAESLSGPWFTFFFIGDLPTYVSFVLNNPFEMANGVFAKGPNGYTERVKTEGWIRGMSTELSTPYIPNQMVTLRSDFGISSVEISSQSGILYLDNLTFYYATETVPEPHAFVLLILGFVGIFYRHTKYYREKYLLLKRDR